jgi:hypothetical protein
LFRKIVEHINAIIDIGIVIGIEKSQDHFRFFQRINRIKEQVGDFFRDLFIRRLCVSRDFPAVVEQIIEFITSQN